MSIVTVKAWHCDVCGYEWLKTAKVPIRCANPERRCRNWNKDIRPLPALPNQQHVINALIHHSLTCKCLVCRPEGK